MGIGNELKCDDGAGPFIVNRLNIDNEKVIIIDGQTVPENFTGQIKKEEPSHLIILDACLMDSNPGTVKVVDENNFVNIGISTHSMSLSFFVKYLKRESDFKILFIGIEPESMDYSGKPTETVEESCLKLIDIIQGIL